MWGNFGAIKAAAMARINNNQQTQPTTIGSVFGAARVAANQQPGSIGSIFGAARTATNQQPGGMFGAARAAAAAKANQGTVPGTPGGVFAGIMRGRNVANQNQLTSTAINPSAFNTGTVGQVFNQNYVDPVLSGNAPLTQKKSSPLKQDMNNSIDPLTGQYIDPTMSQGLDPGTVDPMLDQEDTSLTQY